MLNGSDDELRLEAEPRFDLSREQMVTSSTPRAARGHRADGAAWHRPPLALAAAMTLAALIGACTRTDGPPLHAEPSEGGPSDGSGEAALSQPPPLPSPFDGPLSDLKRGEYLARHVMGCVECHTPHLTGGGELDETELFVGVENLVDLDPQNPKIGAIHSRNLTPDPTAGIGAWTDDEIKNAITNGVARNNMPLYPIMPYYVYHNMTDTDVADIILYLRSIPANPKVIPPRQSLPDPLIKPADPVPLDAIPDTTLPSTDPNYPSAERGKYIASMFCMYCHSPESAPGSSIPIDVTRLFTGHRKFAPFPLSAVPPGDLPMIQSRNLTPDKSGIGDYEAKDFRRAIKLGQTNEGISLCPPMPVGPLGSFGDFTDADAYDIGHYLTTIPPVAADPVPTCCSACHRDGGVFLAANPFGTNPPPAAMSRAASPAANTAAFHVPGVPACASLVHAVAPQ